MRYTAIARFEKSILYSEDLNVMSDLRTGIWICGDKTSFFTGLVERKTEPSTFADSTAGKIRNRPGLTNIWGPEIIFHICHEHISAQYKLALTQLQTIVANYHNLEQKRARYRASYFIHHHTGSYLRTQHHALIRDVHVS